MGSNWHALRWVVARRTGGGEGEEEEGGVEGRRGGRSAQIYSVEKKIAA